MQVQARVDTNILELQQLKSVASELELALEEKKALYKQLKKDIKV